MSLAPEQRSELLDLAGLDVRVARWLRISGAHCDHSRQRSQGQWLVVEQDLLNDNSRPKSPATVILVHGLWMSGWQLQIMRRRFASAGFRAVCYSYPSISRPMSFHARGLLDFAQAQNAEHLHFVGHSLGAIVVLRALELTADLPPGRAVLLGPPLQGSLAAQSIVRWLPFGRTIIGEALHGECVEHSPREWRGQREVGIIAGSVRVGLGRVIATLQGDHDGTVTVEETYLPGAKDHIILPTTHTSMVFSASVAEQAGWFLKHGTFKR